MKKTKYLMMAKLPRMDELIMREIDNFIVINVINSSLAGSAMMSSGTLISKKLRNIIILIDLAWLRLSDWLVKLSKNHLKSVRIVKFHLLNMYDSNVTFLMTEDSLKRHIIEMDARFAELEVKRTSSTAHLVMLVYLSQCKTLTNVLILVKIVLYALKDFTIQEMDLLF